MIKFFEHLPYWIVIVVLLIWGAIKYYTPSVVQVVNKISTVQAFDSTIHCKLHGFVLYSPTVDCTVNGTI